MALKKIRRSQYITPFGVGSILDIGNESLIAMDITHWKNDQGEKINLKRLAKKLGVREFRMPQIPNNPWDTNTAKLPFFRFPRWLFCSSCRSLKFWTYQDERELDGRVPKCQSPKCFGKVLTPMRFVAACKDGHLTDIDWRYWAHWGAQGQNCQDNSSLKFRTKSNQGGSLASLEIFCSKCKAKRDLSDLFKKDNFVKLGIKCSSKQPWQTKDEIEEPCGNSLQAIQRGASNIYFPKVISALDIPTDNFDDEESDIEQQILTSKFFEAILKKYNSSTSNVAQRVIDVYIEELLSQVEGSTEEMIKNLYMSKDNHNDVSNNEPINEEEVLAEEWPILLNPPKRNNNQIFSASIENLSGIKNSYGLEKIFEKIVLVDKLREVRVLRGFQRINPSNDDFVPVDLKNKKDWLPATEVFGEGIFIAFSIDKINEWEKKNSKSIDDRLSTMQNTHTKEELDFLKAPTPRFVLLHTFAHLLIRQLSFECGYSSSSLRERIYSDDNKMAGILIYTADSDSEGALGGLVRQGKSDRFIPTVLTALERGSWCSSDPVCRELPGQGMRGLNKAACHSCALLAETSCISHNALLDRMLLVGKDEKSNYGFFNPIIDKYLSELNK